MKTRITAQMVVLTVVSAFLFALTTSWARPNSVFDQLDLLVDIRHELMQGYVDEPDQQALIEAAVRGMIDSLNDPHTSFLTTEDLEGFDRQVRGTFSGIGAEVDLHENRLRIVTPLEDSPAWEAGVMAGDMVLEIDGESTLGMSLTEAVRKLTGEAGTDVNIRVRHESGEEQDITITRDVINIQTVRGFRRDTDQQYELFVDRDNRIGYLRLTQFTERTAGELRTALQQLNEQEMRGLVLDMRFNPGGLLESAVEVSDMFLPQGSPIASVEGRSVSRQEFAARTAPLVNEDIPIVVLANESSASAAEIVTGALQDNDRALFVGARTFGKGSVQQVRMLEGGRGALKMTNAYYYVPSGRLIHRRDDSDLWGVDPTEGSYVPMSPEQMREMLEIRRDGDRVLRDNGNRENGAVTPETIEEQLKDMQLAAALRAMLGKLDTGDWPSVGESGVDELIAASRRQTLEQQRQALRDRLSQLESEMDRIDAGEWKPGDETAAIEGDAGELLDEGDEPAIEERQPEELEPVEQ
ncbi:S41 family peptidase [Phycisphaerales bacterium AB-hyl4]|uniref:S41 family peptidase n=1 Tax=Natronomicrosphaera hydrolytica TaxID=3242702 RepID=A0ABV4U7Q3_9BACT